MIKKVVAETSNKVDRLPAPDVVTESCFGNEVNKGTELFRCRFDI